MKNRFDELAQKGIVFSVRPDSIPYNYRISYMVSLLCLIVKMCGGRKGCSLIKFHIITSVLEDKDLYKELMAYISNKNTELFIRFSPAVNRALEFSLASGLITQQANLRYRLDNKGKLLVERIIQDRELLVEEKHLLNEISSGLSEELIDEIKERWQVIYA